MEKIDNSARVANEEKIDKSFRVGVIYNFISKYSNIALSLLITSILARLLTPDEFGIVGVVTVFVTFFNMLGDMGVGPAIIQNKGLKKQEIEDIFLITVIIGLIISIVFAIFSNFIAIFYNNNVYIKIGRMLSIAIFFYIANIVPVSILYKQKRFRDIALGSIIINIVVGITVIILANIGFSYYTLVFQSILTSLLTFSYNTLLSKVRISRNINFKSFEKIFNYSKFQFLFNIINYFSRNSDNMLIGKYIGVNELGFYDKAYKLMLYPVQNLTFVITPVLHPILSEHQNNKKLIMEIYVKLTKLLAILGGFFTIVCFFGAKEIILILYGEQWLESSLTFKILSMTIIFQMISSSSGVIFQSTGDVDKLFLSGWISAVINVTGILCGIFIGEIEYVALGIAICFIINFFQTFYILIKYVFKESYIMFLYNFKNIILAMISSTFILNFTNLHFNNPLISIIFKTIIISISYGTVLLFTKEYRVFNILKKVR